MSLWYSCTFAAIGTDAEIEKLNAGCDTYWHDARVEKRLSPGFVQVQASRNYGAHDAIEKMVTDFPGVIFVGSLYDDQNLASATLICRQPPSVYGAQSTRLAADHEARC